MLEMAHLVNSGGANSWLLVACGSFSSMTSDVFCHGLVCKAASPFSHLGCGPDDWLPATNTSHIWANWVKEDLVFA